MAGPFATISRGKASYRRAKRSDIPAIARFQIACARESEGLKLQPQVCRQGVTAIFDRPSMGHYFVCEKAGRVVGCMAIQYEWSDWRNVTAWWIHSVYVEPDHRGQGLYKGLYEHVKKLAMANRKVFALRLYVDTKNTAAQAVYEKLGMSKEHYKLCEWMKPLDRLPLRGPMLPK